MAIRHKGRKHGRDNASRSSAGAAGRGNAPTKAAGPGPQRRATDSRPARQRPPRGAPARAQGTPAQGRPAQGTSARETPARETPGRETPALGPAPGPSRGTPPQRARAAPPSREGGLWLYGRHAVVAALANPARRIRRFLAVAETAAEAKALIATPGARLPAGPQPEILPRDSFEALVPAGAVHQGIALAVEPLPELAIEDVIDRIGPPPAPGAVTQIVVLLDQVTDPHNIGAVLRSAAGFGALALVLPEHGAPPITGTLAKAASGAIEHVPILRVVNLARAIDRLKSAGFWCVGLAEDAERTLPELKLEGRIALVLGGEGDGMRRLTRERCDLVARLPTSGPIASLNVSNAAAIALYELVRGAPSRP